MPRKRRTVRPVRRPNFKPAPEPSKDEAQEPPTFADEPPVPVSAGFGAGGPVETRSYRVPREDRAQGRRMAQLRRSTGEGRAAPRAGMAGQLPMLSRAYVTAEMRRILITTVALSVLLIVLAVVLR